MLNKLITELTEEELLKLLEDKEGDNFNLTDYKNDLLEFISFYQLRPGTNKVTPAILFELYKLWSKKPIKQKAFTKQMGEMLPTERTFSLRYYLLNCPQNSVLGYVIKYLKTHNKTHSKVYKQHFDNFLKKYEIKNGSFFIKDFVLFDLYDQWVYQIRKRRPFSYNQFQNFCKLYFEHKYIEPNNWYGVDQSIIRYLSEEMTHALKTKKKHRYGKKNNNKKNKR